MIPDRTAHVDVTNTLAAPSTTGIQRVTIELVRRRRIALAHGFRLQPITHDEHGWRRLTDDEHGHLRSGGRRAGPGPIRRRVAGTALAAALSSLRARVPGRPSPRSSAIPDEADELRRPVFTAGDLFLDCDAAWHVDPPRSELLHSLRSAGVSTALMAYDTLPFERPEWFVPAVRQKFCAHVEAHLRGGSLVACISEDSRRRLAIVADRLGAPPVDAVAIALGADGAVDTAADPVPAVPDTFVLCVGTVEPRKNHAMLLDAWETLLSRHRGLATRAAEGSVGLVVVGRLGWRSDELARRLRRLEHAAVGVRWMASLDDGALASLYRRAALLAMPSRDEGLGLPVLEARRHAVPVVASDRGGLPEALGEGGILCDPDDPEAWVRALGVLLSDDVERQMLIRASAADPPPTWDESSRQLWSLVSDRVPPI